MLPKRKASELLKLYQLKPNLQDAIVEGVVDKFVLVTLTDGHLPFGSSIYAETEIEIDTIEVDNIGGARERVIRLCHDLQQKRVPNLKGIIDRDLDPADTSRDSWGSLIPTKHTSLDFHLVSTSDIFGVVELAFRLKFTPEFVSNVSNWSRCLYAIRIYRSTNRSSDVIPSVRKIINNKKCDDSRFLCNVLEKMDSRNGSGRYWRDSLPKVLAIYADLKFDLADSSNFHDLEEVFSFALIAEYGVDGSIVGKDWLHRLLRTQLKRGVITDEFVSSAVSHIWGPA